MRAAVTCLHLQRDIDAYRAMFADAGVEVVLPRVPGQELSGDELVAAMAGVDGVIAGDDRFDAAVLDALPGLRVISKWGIGLDGIDLGHAAEIGVTVTNTPGVFGHEVAEQALGYLITLVRGQHLVDRGVRAGLWPKPVGRSLGSLRACVLGLGNIGQTLAEKLQLLGLSVCGVDPGPEAVAWCEGRAILHGELADLVGDVDVLIVTAPLNEHTRGLVDATVIGAMMPGSWLINVGRGPVVVGDAVAEAVMSGHLAGAALDVFEQEPLTDSILTTLPEMILGSHNASNTHEACQRTHVRAIENLVTGLGVA